MRTQAKRIAQVNRELRRDAAIVWFFWGLCALFDAVALYLVVIAKDPALAGIVLLVAMGMGCVAMRLELMR